MTVLTNNFEPMPNITITLNGEARKISEGLTILQLVNDLNLDLNKIAIEKNLEIINNTKFDKEILLQGDKIEIVHFIGGG